MSALHRLARTIDALRDELLAHFDSGGVSKRRTEAVNLLIKEIKSKKPVTASGTSTTTGYCCTAAPAGTLTDGHHREAGFHVPLLRASQLAQSRPL